MDVAARKFAVNILEAEATNNTGTTVMRKTLPTGIRIALVGINQHSSDSTFP